MICLNPFGPAGMLRFTCWEERIMSRRIYLNEGNTPPDYEYDRLLDQEEEFDSDFGPHAEAEGEPTSSGNRYRGRFSRYRRPHERSYESRIHDVQAEDYD